MMTKKKEKEKKKEKKSPQNNDDFVYEDFEEISEEKNLSQKIKKLRDALKAEKEKSQEYLLGWQKERASFANYKSQEMKHRAKKEEDIKYSFVKDLFPVLDSFDMAFANKEAWEKVDSAWRTGVEYIYQQFMDLLKKYGVEKIDQKEIPFDPQIHDPLEMIPIDDKKKDHLVADLVQTGYRVGDTVLRPAKVKVYEFIKK